MKVIKPPLEGESNMLLNNYSEKIVGLQGINIENVKETDDKLHIYCDLKRKAHDARAVEKQQHQFMITEIK